MSAHSKVVEFYGEIVACRRCSFDRDGILVNQELGFIPRGFYSEGEPGRIELMAVAQNPGSGRGTGFTETWETRQYKGKSAPEQARLTLELQGRVFGGERLWPSDFQMILQDQLAWVLNVAVTDVWKKAVLTQAVKCSTPGNRVLRAYVRRLCSRTHLLKEIEFWKPRLIVAVGKVAFEDLQKLGFDVPWIYHPSPRNRNNPKRMADNERRLAELRRILGMSGPKARVPFSSKQPPAGPAKPARSAVPGAIRQEAPATGTHRLLMEYALEFRRRHPEYSIGHGATQVSLTPPGRNVALAFRGKPPTSVTVDVREEYLKAGARREFALSPTDSYGFCHLLFNDPVVEHVVKVAERLLGLTA